MANFYKGSFVNTQVDYSDNSPNEQTIYVKITNTAENDLSEVALETADAPVVFQTVDNSEDKFTPIKSKSCTLRVFTNDDVNAMTFSEGGDQQYKVEIAVGTETDIIFTGWLSISDLGQTFQPDPNVLILTASDGIAFLRDIELSDNEGRYLTGPHQIIKYIAWSLQKTGLELEIWVEMNLLEESATYDVAADHFYNMLYLNAQTFETSIGESENCFSVLEKIFKEFCDLSQQNNVWFIRSTDEAGYAIKRVCKFTYDGEPIGYSAPFLVKDIGANYDMAFMNDDARLSLQRPYEKVNHIYDYNYPEEIVQNLDFQRGDVIVPPDFSTMSSTGTYRPEGWTHLKAITDQPAAGYIADIIKTYDFGYIKDTALRLSQPSPIGATLFVNNVRSTPFYVQAGDRLTISVDVRISANINIFTPIQVRLTPYSGANSYDWELDATTVNAAGEPVTNQWRSVNPSAFLWYTWTVNNSYPNTVTATHSIIVNESGIINIRLLNANYQISTLWFSSDTWFSKLSIDILPKINGSYQKVIGQEHISEQAINTSALREESVFVSDAPRIEMKGALLTTQLGNTLFSGNAIFADGNSVNLDGFQTIYFSNNQYIDISNTNLNNGKFRIVNVEYASIPNKTILTFAEPTQSETDASTTIKGYNYQLSGDFYNSILYPNGGPSITFTTVNVYTINIAIGAIVMEDYQYNISFDYYLDLAIGPMYSKSINYTTTAGITTADQVVNAIIPLLNGANITCTNLGGGVMQVQVDTGPDRAITNLSLSVGYSGTGQGVLCPYGQHQNQAVWNQYNRVFTAFEATVDGLDTDKTYDGAPDLPDLWHLYRQRDTHPATTNKGFKLLHYEQDTDNCEWGLYMIEIVDSTIPKTYEGHSFKYIQE